MTSAVPPAPVPIVPVQKSRERSYKSRFVAKCAHSGSDTTSGSSSSENLNANDDEQNLSSFLDDDPIMSRSDKKRVYKFMKKYIGSRGRKTKKRK